jgi:hypothetical protein
VSPELRAKKAATPPAPSAMVRTTIRAVFIRSTVCSHAAEP